MRYIEWAVMFIVAGLGIALANFVGFQVSFVDSLPGIAILLLISLASVGISKIVPLKLPVIAYCSLLGLFLACPLSPIRDFVIESAGKMKEKIACDILIKNTSYLDENYQVQENASIVIADGKILKIFTNKTKQENIDVTNAKNDFEAMFAPEEVIDGENLLWMPGPVDGHMHTGQQLLKGAVLDELPMIWTRIMPAKKILKIATENGAAVIGEEKSGVLKEGYKADMISINWNQIHLLATSNKVNTLLECVCGNDVQDSVVGGRMLMRKRQVLTLDEEKIMWQAKRYFACGEVMD